jgi:hypothetical protein
MGARCLPGANATVIKFTYHQQRKTNKKTGMQGFIVLFFTERFGDRLGMR